MRCGRGSRAQAVRGSLRFHLGRDNSGKPAAGKAERGRLCRPLQCRQVQPGQCADRPQKPGAGVADARRHPPDQFLQSGGPADAGRPARLWLRQSAPRPKREAWQEMIFSYLRRPRAPAAGGAADRRAAGRDGQRPAGDGAAGPGRGFLWPGADQGRRAEAGGPRRGAGRPPPRPRRHTAALAEVQLTSALAGDGIAALRTHLADLAQ